MKEDKCILLFCEVAICVFVVIMPLKPTLAIGCASEQCLDFWSKKSYTLLGGAGGAGGEWRVCVYI